MQAIQPRKIHATAPVGRLQSSWVVVNGLRMHARVSVDPAPSGHPPVLLVHGLAVSSRYFVPTARHLAPYHRVYSPDFPGFGRSDNPPHVLDIGELADTLLGYMDAVGIERAPMIANSLGCQVVADFAVRYPDRFDRAILIGPTMDRHAPSLWWQFGRLLRDSIHEPFWQPFVVGYDYLRTGVHRTITTARYGMEDRIEEKLPHIHAPLIIMRGASDPIAPRRWTHELAALAPQGRHIEVPNAAHTVNFSDPVPLVQIARDFFGQTSALNSAPERVMGQPLVTESQY